jgi:segregation and condensation protein A
VSPVIQIERFEGPLALLLHLISKEEMNIFDINIHQITTQYLEYIKAMKSFDLENAGEFVALAATLIQIKSKMLLPQYNEAGEVVETEDPRQELVKRLLEYQRFQDAAKRLYDRPLLGRDVWLRGDHPPIEGVVETEIAVDDNPLFSLITAYRSVLRSVRSTVHNVSMALQSVSSRILELRQSLVVGLRVGFSELITVPAGTGAEARSNQVLVTFLSLLELARMGFVSLFQSEPQSEMYIESKRTIMRDVVLRAESYDGTPTSQTAKNDILTEEPAEATTSDQLVLAESHALPAAQPSEDVVAEEVATDEEILAEEQRLSSGDLEL